MPREVQDTSGKRIFVYSEYGRNGKKVRVKIINDHLVVSRHLGSIDIPSSPLARIITDYQNSGYLVILDRSPVGTHLPLNEGEIRILKSQGVKNA
jgi:hypothetical protein